MFLEWLTVKESAALLEISDRAVRKSVENNIYISQYVDGIGGNSGKQLLIALESLPQEAQDRYHKRVLKENTAAYTNPGKHIEDAEFKASVVKSYLNSHLDCSKFLRKYNEEHETSITLKQLYSWRDKFRTRGVEGLIDKRGGHNRGHSSVPDDAWEFFKAAYLSQDRRTFEWCYRETKKQFPEIPSLQAFKTRYGTIPEATVILERFGKEAYKALTPYYERDPACLDSNDIWFSDHTPLDILVNVEGKLRRVTLTLWTDAHSRKLLSWIVRAQAPNTDIVKQTLGEAIKLHGVPKEVYVDNGKDYRAKDGLDNDNNYSMAHLLGINTIYATAYHGQAKTIERFFKTLEDQFSKQFKTYIGRNAQDRPERTKKKNDAQLLKMAPTFIELKQKLEDYFAKFNETAHGGKGMDGLSPNEVYYRDLKEKREISEANMDGFRLLCGRNKVYTVQRNGLRVNDATFYNMELVLRYSKQKVRVFYDPANIDEITVTDLEGRFICSAKANAKSVFRDRTADDYREAKHIKKEFYKLVKSYGPDPNIDVNMLIAQKQAEELAALPERTVSETTEIVPYEVPLMKELSKGTEPTADNEQEANSDEITKAMLNYLRKIDQEGGIA